MTWHEFISMGGYGIFVWSAYGVAVVVVAGLAYHSSRKFNKLIKKYDTSRT